MADVLEKQMKKEEGLASKEISKAITAALNSKDTIAKADKINGSCGGWPYAPTKDMLKLYGNSSEAAWKKLKPKYSNFDVSIAVNSPSKKPPVATAEAVFDGGWKGGKSMMVSSGDTIMSMAKKLYGYESYADQVYEANAKALGKSCKVIPAGFGLEFPKIWVPNWKKDPNVCMYPVVKKKAVKVKLPSMEAVLDLSTKSTEPLYLGNVIVTIELEGKAELTAQKKGEMNETFAIKPYEAELKKGFGPLEAGFKVGAKGTSSGSLDLKVFNSKIGGLNYSGKVKLLEGAFEVAMGTKKFTTVYKGITYNGSITLTAKVRIIPNPRKLREKAPSKRFVPEISAKEVGVVVLVVVVVVVVVAGGWMLIAGGVAIEGVAALGALGLAVAVGS